MTTAAATAAAVTLGAGGAVAADEALDHSSLGRAPQGLAADPGPHAPPVAFGPDWRFGSVATHFSGPTSTSSVALTFDDGPTPEFTPRVLAALAAAGAKATFCLLGANAAAHPDLVAAIVAAGHEIANHSWSHTDPRRMDDAETLGEFVACDAVLRRVAGTTGRFLRPPRGHLSEWVMQSSAYLGRDVLMWSRTRGEDPGAGTAAAVAAEVGASQAGDIVCLHDGLGRMTFFPDHAQTAQLRARRDVEIAALPGAIARIQASGLRLVTVSTLLGG